MTTELANKGDICGAREFLLSSGYTISWQDADFIPDFSCFLEDADIPVAIPSPEELGFRPISSGVEEFIRPAPVKQTPLPPPNSGANQKPPAATCARKGQFNGKVPRRTKLVKLPEYKIDAKKRAALRRVFSKKTKPVIRRL